MVSYLSRLENLIEKWQSRRKTIEISHTRKQSSAKAAKTNRKQPNLHHNSDPDPQLRSSNSSSLSSGPATATHEANKRVAAPGDTSPVQVCCPQRPPEAGPATASSTVQRHNQIAAPPKSPVCYTLSVFVLLLGALQQLSELPQLTLAAAGGNKGPADTPAARQFGGAGGGGGPEFGTGLARQFGQLGLDLIQQLASGPALPSLLLGGAPSRWIQVPDPQHSIRNPPSRRQTRLSRMLSRLRNQIGARNTIRVHNAFRDMAWRLLSSLSMPTPVIYELRRQHLYAPEDDLMNDSFYNKNTSRTIRSKRQLLLDLWPSSLPRTPSTLERRLTVHDDYGDLRRRAGSASGAADEDDDDDSDDSLRGRMRSRMEDILYPSGRGLFGRVIRVPGLFKRQEEGSGRIGRRRRRRKEADRQMISINGKQYYVNDEGELKEWNSKSNS